MNRLPIMLNNRKPLAFPATMAAAFVLLAGGANALANTVWCVPKASLNPSCTTSTTQPSIGAAVGLAASGDVIVVGPGTYPESVTISTPYLSLLGAQAGKDARLDRYDRMRESIVDATGTTNGTAFDVEASNVIIDGFTIQGATAGNSGSGIYVGSYSSTQILNNIIQNNAAGIYLYYGYYDLIEHNVFKANNKGATGSWDEYFSGLSGIGIAGEPYYGDAIIENEFIGNLATAMALYQGYGDAITKNTSNNDGSFVIFYECGDTHFSHNQGQNFGARGVLPISSGPTYADAAIEITFHSYSLQINDNDLGEGRTPDFSGISFAPLFEEYACYYCQVSKNRIKGFPGNGIVGEGSTSTGVVEYSGFSGNKVEDNRNDGIVIENAPYSNNTLLDNEAEGNSVFDCADNTAGSWTAGTANTWFNNFGNSSSPTGLCTARARQH